MRDTIFMKNSENKLVSLSETLYQKEEHLQEIIANNPVLLAGEQINPDEPRKWIHQMQNTEVLGLEIKRFTSTDGNQLFIPRIIGKTLQASEIKGKKKSKKWDRESFLKDVYDSSGEAMRQLAKKMIAEFEGMNCRIWYGTGATHGSFVVVYDKADGTKCQLFSFYPWTTKCFVELYFQYYKAPYDTEEQKVILKRKFEDALGIVIGEDRLNGRPSFAAEKLLDDGRYSGFKEIIEGMICGYGVELAL